MKWKGSRRNRSWPNQCTILQAFHWPGWGKPRETSVRIRAEGLQNSFQPVRYCVPHDSHNDPCAFWASQETHEGKKCSYLVLMQVVNIVTAVLQRVNHDRRLVLDRALKRCYSSRQGSYKAPRLIETQWYRCIQVTRCLIAGTEIQQLRAAKLRTAATQSHVTSAQENTIYFLCKKGQSFRHTWKTDRSQRHRLLRDSKREAEGSFIQAKTRKCGKN
jgi:hypothetical protein